MLNVSFVVHGDPVGQGRPRTAVRNGHAIIYKPANSKKYESEVTAAAREAMGGLEPITTPIHLTLAIMKSPPSGATKKQRQAMLSGEILPTKKPDLDNVLKAVADALTGVVWEDDKQVTTVHAYQRYAEKPCIRVYVQDDCEKGEDP